MWPVILLPRMNSAQVSLSHIPAEDLALLGTLACCRTISHCLSTITLSLSARFSSRLRSSACPFTQSYVMSRPRHHFSCRSLVVLNKSWSPSMRWKILYVLNYSHSRNPGCIRAHTHRHIQAPREPLNSRVCWRVCTLSQDRT
jgi:hypothetical protein